MLAPILTLVFLGVLAVILPWMAWASRQQLTLLRSVPKPAFYTQAILVQLLLGGFSMLVAYANKFELAFFGPGANQQNELIVAIVITASALLLLMVGLRYADAEQRRLYRIMTPVTFSEKIFWTVLTLVVAFAEEITYRSVLPQILQLAIPEPLVVVIVSSLLFGAAHLLQGVSAAVTATFIGLALHTLVLTGGRLNSAIAVHFLYDVVAGFYIGQRLAREAEEEGEE